MGLPQFSTVFVRCKQLEHLSVNKVKYCHFSIPWLSQNTDIMANTADLVEAEA